MRGPDIWLKVRKYLSQASLWHQTLGGSRQQRHKPPKMSQRPAASTDPPSSGRKSELVGFIAEKQTGTYTTGVIQRDGAERGRKSNRALMAPQAKPTTENKGGQHVRNQWRSKLNGAVIGIPGPAGGNGSSQKNISLRPAQKSCIKKASLAGTKSHQLR